MFDFDTPGEPLSVGLQAPLRGDQRSNGLDIFAAHSTLWSSSMAPVVCSAVSWSLFEPTIKPIRTAPFAPQGACAGQERTL